MKKTYQNPTIAVVCMQAQNLLAGSGPAVGNAYDGSSTLLGREADDFEDDEEY